MRTKCPTPGFSTSGITFYFVDSYGAPWHVADYLLTSGPWALVPLGSPAAEYRVFSQMSGETRERRVYAFSTDDGRDSSVETLAEQFGGSEPVPRGMLPRE